jgi:hypothetical protein
MTEEEWLRTTDLKSVFKSLSDAATERKLRLFAVMCYREYLRFRPDISPGSFQKYIDVTERYADGRASFDEWDGVRGRVHGTFHDADPQKQCLFAVDTALCCCPDEAAESQFLVQHIRDILGNPFRPVAFDPVWRTSTAVAVAETIYADRTFGDLPVLADALQDAGCDHPDILAHLRGPAPHVRGCWALDLILGKE